jgi:hypothetical protein
MAHSKVKTVVKHGQKSRPKAGQKPAKSRQKAGQKPKAGQSEAGQKGGARVFSPVPRRKKEVSFKTPANPAKRSSSSRPAWR